MGTRPPHPSRERRVGRAGVHGRQDPPDPRDALDLALRDAGGFRWLLALTAPRARAAVAWYDRQLGITPAVITRANRAIASALAGGAQLTRAELRAVLTGTGVRVDGTQRLAHVIMHAELDAVICSGARRGKQFTYALLGDRAPSPPSRLARTPWPSARRYFTSHGPAQLKDFAWWSGLTSAEAEMPRRLSNGDARMVEEAARRYGDFLGRSPRSTSMNPARGDWGHGHTLDSRPSSPSQSSLRRTQRRTIVRPTPQQG